VESRWINIEKANPCPSLFWISFVHMNSACKEYYWKFWSCDLGFF
jgi:hypothetical protein